MQIISNTMFDVMNSIYISHINMIVNRTTGALMIQCRVVLTVLIKKAKFCIMKRH